MRNERSLITRYSLLIAHHSSLVTHRSLLIARHSSLVTHHSSLVTHGSSLITRNCSLTTLPIPLRDDDLFALVLLLHHLDFPVGLKHLLDFEQAGSDDSRAGSRAVPFPLPSRFDEHEHDESQRNHQQEQDRGGHAV